MKRALGGARPVHSMEVTRSTSLEISKKTDTSEEELQHLIEPTEQKTPVAAFHLNVQGETLKLSRRSKCKMVFVEAPGL